MNPFTRSLRARSPDRGFAASGRRDGYAAARTLARTVSAVIAANRGGPWRLFALLHDAHEAYLGDVVTPTVTSLGAVLFEMGLTKKDDAAHQAMKVLKNRSDAAIFTALGLPTKLPGSAYHAIKVLEN